MLAQHDGHITDKRDVTDNTPNNIPSLEVILPASVQLRVVGGVVVPLRQEAREGPGAEPADDAVDDGDVLVADVVHDDLAHVGLGQQVPVPEEEEVATLEGGLHGSGEDDDDGGGGVGEDG